MILGNFKPTGTNGEYEGKIETFVMSVPAKLVPVVDRQHDKSPDLRFVSNEKVFGAAWKKTSKDGKDYHSVALDHPGLDTGCALFKETEGDGLVLVWNRSDKSSSAKAE